MQKEVPAGVKIARIVNVLLIAVNIVVAMLMLAIAIPNFIKAAQDAGKIANPILLIREVKINSLRVLNGAPLSVDPL